MSRTLTLQLDDEVYRRLSAAAQTERRSVVSFIESAIRTRIREQASREISDGGQPRGQSARGRTLERLFELFEGHDAEEEIRRLKERMSSAAAVTRAAAPPTSQSASPQPPSEPYS